MKTKFFIIIFILVSSFFLINCSDENNDEIQNLKIENKERKKFLEGKNFEERKKEFKLLSKVEKFTLWNEKNNQLLTLELPKEHLILIQKLKDEYFKSVYNKENDLKEVFIELAKIIPEDEFIKMFFELDDYNYKNNFNIIIKNDNFINYLKTCDYKYDNIKINIDNSDIERVAPDCNCNYSCSAQTINPAICSSSNCSPTADGCGPFGLSGCDGRVYFC